MSMLGLSVGTTPRASMRPLASRRGRMSLAFEPITSRSSGMPQARATQPESTLPKLPVGTAKASAATPEGRPSPRRSRRPARRRAPS